MPPSSAPIRQGLRAGLQQLLYWVLLLLCLPQAAQASLTRQDIERRFGPPLHVQSKLTDPRSGH